MSKENRYLLQGNAGQQVLHGERVPKHVRVAAFLCAILGVEICQLEDAPEAALPIADRGFQFSVPAPKEIPRVRSQGARRERTQRISDMRRQGNIDGVPGLGPVEKQLVLLVQARTLEADGVANGKAAPAHEKNERPYARGLIARFGIPGPGIVDVGGVNDRVKFRLREVVSGSVFRLDSAKQDGWILLNPTHADAEIKEPDHAFLFFLLGKSAALPGVAELLKVDGLDLRDVEKSAGFGPGQELAAENCVQLLES